MAITATGCLGELRYNGYDFGPYTETTSCSVRPVYDEAKRTVIYSLFNFEFRTVIHGRPTDTAVEDARRRLSKPAGEFVFRGRGFGDLSVNTGGKKDVMWGPKPQEVSLRHVGADNATEIKWKIEFALADCVQSQTGAFAVLEFVYKLSFGLDRQGYTVRRHSGHIVIPLARKTQSDRRVYDSADRLRENCIPEPILGFRRLERNFEISEDRSRLDFDVADEQMGPNTPPPGVIEAAVSHEASSSKAGLCQWVHVITGEYEIAPGFPVGSTAVKAFTRLVKDRQKFMDEQLNRSVDSKDKESRAIPIAFSMREPDVYGRPKASFSTTYTRVGDLKSMLNNSGLWRQPPDSDWRKWALSMEDVFGVRGHAKLVFDPGEDRIFDLCDPNPQIYTAPRGVTMREPRPVELRFDDIKVDPKKSYVDYQTWIEIEDDSGVIVVKKLPERTPLGSSSSSGGTTTGGAQAPGPGAGSSSGNGLQLLPPDSSLVELLDSFNNVPAVPSPGSAPSAGAGSGQTSATQSTVGLKRGQPVVYCYLVGRCLRAAYAVTRPKIDTFNGVTPLPANRADRGEGFRTACVGNAGVPLYAATWRLRYALPTVPPGGAPVPRNPLYGG